MLNESQIRMINFLSFYRDTTDKHMMFMGFLFYKKSHSALLYNRKSKKLYDMGLHDTFPGSQFSISLAIGEFRDICLFFDPERTKELFKIPGIEIYDTE